MAKAPWNRPLGVEAVVQDWLSRGQVRRCLAAEQRIAPCDAEWQDIPAEIEGELRRALLARGIRRLYSHQAEAVRAAIAGRNVVIATPTASGKSLCFHLPVLQAMTRSHGASALLLYPTKALSRDQEHSLRELVGEAGLEVAASVYDGDTPGDARRATRERCRIVLTNPDMLHAGILPSHPRWASFIQNLRYVVLDELHTYRGVFGSHMAHVLGRLRRIARFHGANPTFICATATIGNPREHAARLIGVQLEAITLIEHSGAPRASRQFFLYNPPVVNQELGIRASTLKQSVQLAADLVRARVPTLVFGPSRNSVEVMLKYLREKCKDVVAPEALTAYRGGYLPETRRRIEHGLRSGEVLCVVATNALELGIDIGDLDAVVCAGYPGSIAGTWQRFGRAGRRGATSIALLVCSSASLDQFLAREPGYLLNSGAEEARIDPSNLEVLIQHLKCAAFEAPFELSPPAVRGNQASGENYGVLDAAATRDALEYLAGHGLVHASGGAYHWAGEAFPASHVSLRNIGWNNFVIIDVLTDQSIGELDWRAAHTMLHEQAIYQHDAEQYQVERLDYENHKAFVRKVEPDYFTTALTYRSVNVLELRSAARLGNVRIGWGDVKVEEKITGYKKIKFFTHENAGYGDVFLPEIQLHTTSFWLTMPERLVSDCTAHAELSRAEIIDGLRAIGAAFETVSTIGLMCDSRDIGQSLGDGADDSEPESGPRVASAPLIGSSLVALAPGRDPHAARTGNFNPTLFLFDAQPGGVGLAERIYERAHQLLEQTRKLIQTCPCDGGCPACVGPGEEQADRKSRALAVLAQLLPESVHAVC